MNAARLHDLISKIAGRRPVCRARYVSVCCQGPVDVYMGAVEGSPDDWRVPIIRRCALCGLECEGHFPRGEPGSP